MVPILIAARSSESKDKDINDEKNVYKVIYKCGMNYKSINNIHYINLLINKTLTYLQSKVMTYAKTFSFSKCLR